MKSSWRNSGLRGWLAAVLFFAASGLLLYVHTALGTDQRIVYTPPVPLSGPSSIQHSEESIDRRTLVIEWPEKMSKNEKGYILLTISSQEPENQEGLNPQAGEAGNLSSAGLPDIYKTYNPVANARLEMSGLRASEETYKQPVRPGEAVAFRWEVQPDAEGIYQGAVWLHMEFVPKEGGPVEETLLLSRPIEIHSVTLLGYSRRQVQIFGWAGLLLSAAFAYPSLRNRFKPFADTFEWSADQAVKPEEKDL